MATRHSPIAQTGVKIDEGLRQYMLRVYNLMAMAIGVTGLVAYFVAANPALMQTIALGPMKWVLFLAVLGLGFMAPRLILGGSPATAQMAFWTYAICWGALIAPMLYIYTGASVARAFFITSATFAGMSFYGYTTKRDLAPMGRFLAMAVIGIFVAMIANFFFKSSGFDFILSLFVVLVFSAMTAYETQQIKESYYAGDSAGTQNSKAIFGAFLLYGSFVTLFIWILHLVGVTRGE